MDLKSFFQSAWVWLLAIIGPVCAFILKELFSFILNVFFGKAGKRIPSTLEKIRKKRTDRFIKTLNSEEYMHFLYLYLKDYYGETFFSESRDGDKIPVFSIRYGRPDDRADGIRYFDKLGNKEGIDFRFEAAEHQTYKKLSYYKEYHRLVGANILAPDRPGFMLDEILTNEAGMTQFKASIGTYAENIYSDHVLEYELFKLFKFYRRKSKKESADKLLEKCRQKSDIRNAMHASVKAERSSPLFQEQMRRSLLSGEGRRSLLSVQMLVLIKLRDRNDYGIMIIQRSKHVAAAPGRIQLVPSGGFEILNDAVDGYSNYELQDNYSAGCAVFREYLEEIFGEEEFEGRGVGSVNEALMKDDRIRVIERLLKSGEADLRFLGSVMDLAGLRHELSFVLVIHNEDYNDQKFRGNEEILNRTFISDVRLRNFESREDIWKNLHGPSAAMWKLFRETDLYRELIAE